MCLPARRWRALAGIAFGGRLPAARLLSCPGMAHPLPRPPLRPLRPAPPTRRLRAQYGPPPNPMLYVAYFLPTSINAAWLSVASAVQLLVAVQGSQQLPSGGGGDLEVAAVLLAAAVAAGGEPVNLLDGSAGPAPFCSALCSLLFDSVERASGAADGGQRPEGRPGQERCKQVRTYRSCPSCRP